MDKEKVGSKVLQPYLNTDKDLSPADVKRLNELLDRNSIPRPKEKK